MAEVVLDGRMTIPFWRRWVTLECRALSSAPAGAQWFGAKDPVAVATG